MHKCIMFLMLFLLPLRYTNSNSILSSCVSINSLLNLQGVGVNGLGASAADDEGRLAVVVINILMRGNQIILELLASVY